MAGTSTDRRQGVTASAAVKVPCKAATTANITLSGEQTVDGVALVTGGRCLVKNQTTASENGIYVVDTSSWQRARDWDGALDIRKGTTVRVTNGTANVGWWYVTTSDPITIGTTSVNLSRTTNVADSSILSVANLTALRTLDVSVLSNNDTVDLIGYYNPGDGGGGSFYWNSTSTDADDSGVTILPTGHAGAGRWKRIYSGSVNVKWFGAKIDGVTDDTTAIQAAINYAKSLFGEVYFPAGDCKITGVNVNGAVKISGVDSSTAGSRVFIIADAPAFNVTAACTIDGIAIIGEGSGVKTNQHGVKITSINDVYLRNIFFDNCYNDVHIFGEVFYTYLDGCRWYRSVNTMLYAEGNTAPGFAIQILNCQATPPSGNRGFWFKNYGSVIIDSLMMSPNNLTNEGVFFDTPASSAGIQQINNTVIEGSDGVPLKIVGASGASQAKFLFCSNSYFGSGSTQPVIQLTDVRGAYFSNCYFTGAGDGFALYGTINSVHITDGEFEVTSVPIVAAASSAISGMYVTNPDYQSAAVFIDLNNASSKSNVSVVGGIIGSNANPVQPASMAGLYVRLPGVTKFNNGGIATFNGGVSLFNIAHGLVSAPTKFSVVSNSVDAGTAEIREVVVDASNVSVQCKAAATTGTSNVKWAWMAEV